MTTLQAVVLTLVGFVATLVVRDETRSEGCSPGLTCARTHAGRTEPAKNRPATILNLEGFMSPLAPVSRFPSGSSDL